MRFRLLPLLIAAVLLSVNLLSVDFDGGMFEGKGIETAVLPVPSGAKITPADAPGAAGARVSALGEGRTVTAFEVPFTLVGKYVPPAAHASGILPLEFPAPRIIVRSVRLVCPMIPRAPPRHPTDLRSLSLRAPPAPVLA